MAGRVDAEQLKLRRERFHLDQLVADFEATMPDLAMEAFEHIVAHGDPVLLRHAIGNLLSNAAKHGRNRRGASPIQALVQHDSGDAVVAISDAGPGVRDIDPKRIFDRHRRNGSSSGVGLWIVTTIVNEHDGVVEVFANEPMGTTFELRLPVTHT